MATSKELSLYYKNIYPDKFPQLQIQSSNREYYKNHLQELLLFGSIDSKQILTIVDYGCSYPIFLIEAKDNGLHAIGIELNQQAQQMGRENGITMLTHEEFIKRVPDRSIDIMRFSHVLEHSIDPVNILQESVSKLRHGGFVYITQPNFPVFSYAANIDVDGSCYPNHLHFFSPISLYMLVGKAGLRLKKFFTHTRENEVLQYYSGYLDLDYATRRLSEIALAGDNFFGNQNNYPIYAGKNSVLFAIE